MTAPQYSVPVLMTWLHDKYPELEMAGEFAAATGRWSETGERGVTLVGAATLLGLSGDQLHTCTGRGWVNTWQADEIATFMGIHPSRIWSSWYDDAADEPKCPECGRLLPYDYTHPYVTCPTAPPADLDTPWITPRTCTQMRQSRLARERAQVKALA